ncbi:hypothetical protein [Roseateles agri]|nr:hypothetical protein [Paucibacter sp. R3-3]
MGKDERIERLLIEWAQWLQVGDGSGFSTMSVLHPDWSPPSPGLTPTMKTGVHSSARRTHRAVSALSVRMGNTLVVHYCLRLSLADQAERLQCSASTVTQRVARAHLLLRPALLTHGDGTSARPQKGV